MEDSRKKEFEDYTTERFPPAASKRSTSGVVYAAFGKKVATCLKDPTASDKNFRFWVKKRGFQLLNLPSLGAQDVLVVPVNTKGKEVVLVVPAARKQAPWNIFVSNACKCTTGCGTRKCRCIKQGISCSSHVMELSPALTRNMIVGKCYCIFKFRILLCGFN